MDVQAIRNIKCDLAISYVRTVAARCNCAFEEYHRGFDGIGADCKISQYHIGNQPEMWTPGSEINIQVKGMSCSSTTMFRETKDIFEYKLDKLIATGMLFYLVVLELPEENKIDEWVQINDESLLMKRRAYYVRINEQHNGGFIKIPKNQLFTIDSLPNLFINSVEEMIKKK